LVPIPASVRPEVQRVVAARGEPPVDRHQVLHAADLGGEMMRSCGSPDSSAKAAERSALSIIASRSTSCASSGSPGARVLVHHLREQRLVERAPVHPDAHRLAVLDRLLDDGAEVLVVPLGAHVPRVDAVLGEGAGAVRVRVSRRWPL
jgi:hypothetical protein